MKLFLPAFISMAIFISGLFLSEHVGKKFCCKKIIVRLQQTECYWYQGVYCLLNTMRGIAAMLCHLTLSTEYHEGNCRFFMSCDIFYWIPCVKLPPFYVTRQFYRILCGKLPLFLSCNTFYWIPRGKLPPIYVTWQFYRIFCGKLPPFFIMWHFLLQTMW